MESTRVMMLVTVMIVMALVKTEAQTPPSPGFGARVMSCTTSAAAACLQQPKLGQQILCVARAVEKCIVQSIMPPATPSPSPMVLTNEVDHTNFYCTFGCVTHNKCLSISSFQNPKKAEDCVDSCSFKCSNKN